MGRRGPESFIKRQKELKRKQKAMEKMARRQARKQQKAEGAPAATEEAGIPAEEQAAQEHEFQPLE